MAAQYLTAWSPSAIAAANTALIDVIGAAATAGKITIHNASDTLLATIPLDDPAGTVNASTGVLTITASARDESADASGTASYASLRDGDNNVLRSLPCQAGSSPVAGYCVMPSLSIVSGYPVELVSFAVS